MSDEISSNCTITATVDVNEFAKENGTNSEKSCDSGIETTEAGTETIPGSSDSESSPIKSISNYETDLNLPTPIATETIDNVSEKSLEIGSLQENASSSPLTTTPEDVHTSETPSSESSPFKSGIKKSEHISNRSASLEGVDKKANSEQNVNENSMVTSLRDNSSSQIDSINAGPDLEYKLTDLTASTISLHEQNSTQKLTKPLYSRSAENILHLDPDQTFSISNKSINEAEVLSQFSTQKKQANAVQRIPEHNQPTLDVRYARIPKEILNQDIGSIVKNVHGMFSTVSGSLKYYTHRTVQKPIKTVKPIPNSKVMSDIFEDETNEVPPQRVEQVELVNEGKESNIDSQGMDPKSEVIKLQIETLERLLFEQRKENTSLREKVKQQLDELQEKYNTFKEFEGKLDTMGKRVEQAEREKDAAVMRYASVECAAIEARRAADATSKAERAARAELDIMSGKLKSAHSEKQRIIQLYDDKCHELTNSERELAKVRDDLKELEGRLKWTQSKLRMEMDAFKESSERAERLSQQVSELESARDAVATLATDSARARELEAELKECRASLILCRHEKEDLDRRLTLTSSELDSCRRERDGAVGSLARTTAEVEQLKLSNLRLEEEAAELAALRAKAALADTLASQLERESERAVQAEEALSRARAQSETCARREAAALQHAARLTAEHVTQQASDHSRLAKEQALTADNVALRERVTSLEAECGRLQRALTDETERRNQENRVLARKVAELTEEAAEAVEKLEWEKGEIGVLKKKHASAIKELNRELGRALKRCEQLEAKIPPTDVPSIRTGSITSLSSGESAPQEDNRLQNGHESIPEIQAREPDRQALIERIVSLQRAAARRSERCEFLEEHTKQLTEELRNKSRLLRQILCTMPTGAVTSPNRDLNKKHIASAGGGAMAAVWGGEPEGLSRELSLEMNKRLQAVLEDTLLKNITLKENMDTLGAEISRLKAQKHDAK